MIDLVLEVGGSNELEEEEEFFERSRHEVDRRRRRRRRRKRLAISVGYRKRQLDEKVEGSSSHTKVSSRGR